LLTSFDTQTGRNTTRFDSFTVAPAQLGGALHPIRAIVTAPLACLKAYDPPILVSSFEHEIAHPRLTFLGSQHSRCHLLAHRFDFPLHVREGTGQRRPVHGGKTLLDRR